MAENNEKKNILTAALPVAIICVLASRCGGGLGLGGGAGAPGTGNNEQAVVQQESGAAESQAAETQAESVEVSEAATEVERGTVTVEKENADAAKKEYVIEIKQDTYFIDGAEVNKQKIESLLQDKDTVLKIDNNYGSQKAVTELKSLFEQYDRPYVE